MPTNLKPPTYSNTSIGRLKMVLILDEAKTLVGLDYYNSFRWILYNVIERAFRLGRHATPTKPAPFVAVFLGTHSKVADFLPAGVDSSYRYFASFVAVPPPFTSLDWDVHVSEPYISADRRDLTRVTYSQIEKIGWLSRFGRPVWYARWAMKQSASCATRCEEAQRLIELHHTQDRHAFEAKFEDYEQTEKRLETFASREDFIQTCSAILAVLVGLDCDFSAPQRAADLVASRLRWALGCDSSRKHVFTTYLSEPILAKAASRLFFYVLRGLQKPVYFKILEVVGKEIGKGYYDPGSDGELAAKILCTSQRHEDTDGN